jgi:hypothetical protein
MTTGAYRIGIEVLDATSSTTGVTPAAWSVPFKINPSAGE